MSADIKLRKAQLSKTIRSEGFLCALLGKFAGPLMKVAVLLAKNVLASLPTMASASATDGAIQRKMRGKGVLGITLVILNESMDDIIRIINHLNIQTYYLMELVKQQNTK